MQIWQIEGNSVILPYKRDEKMINRVLIRIKVIQILYSYLLVEKKFTLEEPPANPTKEKRYAYGLYLDMLALMVMISERIERRRGEHPLMKTRFMERIRVDEHVGNAVRRLKSEGMFLDIAARLAETVKESGLYKMYLRDNDKNVEGAEETLWNELFNQIIMHDSSVNRYAMSVEGYTLKGLERMQEMMQGTLTNFLASQDSLSEGIKTLENSLAKARELYFRLLALPVELTYMQERRLDNARHKHLRTEADLNPNMRFVDNEAVKILADTEAFRNYIDENKIDWIHEDPLLMDHLLKSVLDSDLYRNYMEMPETDLQKDAEFWREAYRKIIFNDPNFLESLEESSVFWNDDIDIMGTFVLKTLRRIEERNIHPILDKYKDEEDAKFGSQLITHVYHDRVQYAEWISNAVGDSEWDAERLAFMDVVILETALAEILNFPKIPLNVSINEYIEIAKSYSSAKSGTFVHGVLSRIISRLQESGQLLKR